MSLKKKYLVSKPQCNITFKLSKKLADSFKEVALVGEFNSWNPKANPMKKLKSGEFSVTISLEKGSDYQFKYIADKNVWLNDDEADKQVPNEFQGQNSVVTV